MKERERKQKRQVSSGFMHKIGTAFGVSLCMVLIPILFLNITLLIKSFAQQEKISDIGGVFPLIVLTDSMAPEIQSGDLILCNTTSANEIEVNDVISFFDPAGNGTSIVTHRVIEIVEEEGELFFRTKGDNNNAEDKQLVPTEKLVGTYKPRIPGAGNVAMFLQSQKGLILCVVLPCMLWLFYDYIRRRIYEKNKRQEQVALLAELQTLRAEKAEKEQGIISE